MKPLAESVTTSSLDGMPILAVNVVVPIYTPPGVKRGTMSVKCLAQEGKGISPLARARLHKKTYDSGQCSATALCVLVNVFKALRFFQCFLVHFLLIYLYKQMSKHPRTQGMAAENLM